MKIITSPKPLRCAIYTRKSTEHNLDLAFNSLDAQREACEAYIKSQAHEGWMLVPDRFDDDYIHPAVLHILEQKLQGGAVERSPRESSVPHPLACRLRQARRTLRRA
jgi:hypothetical protein